MEERSAARCRALAGKCPRVTAAQAIEHLTADSAPTRDARLVQHAKLLACRRLGKRSSARQLPHGELTIIQERRHQPQPPGSPSKRKRARVAPIHRPSAGHLSARLRNYTDVGADRNLPMACAGVPAWRVAHVLGGPPAIAASLENRLCPAPEAGRTRPRQTDRNSSSDLKPVVRPPRYTGHSGRRLRLVDHAARRARPRRKVL